MKSYQFTCCERVDAPDQPDIHDQIVVIHGLFTPRVEASTKSEALHKLHQWFVDHKCRPYQEVT